MRDAVQVEPVEPLDLKGKSEPVPAFRLIDVADHAAGLERPLAAPLVGRERELALLRDAFDRAVSERHCELVTVVGPAGLGKSRLASDFAHSVRGEAVVAEGRCLSYGEGLTFWPLRDIVAELTGTEAGASPEDAQAGIEKLLPADDDTATIVERVSGALGLADTVAAPRRDLLGACASCSRPSPRASRWSSCSRTSTGPSRRCST